MLEAGGTCEFSSQTLRSHRRGAHVSPTSARASDPAAPPSGIAHASDDATSPMRTRKTHRLKTCATRRGSEGLPGSRAAPGDRKPEPTPGRRRRRDNRRAVASVRRRAWAAPSLIHARASSVSRIRCRLTTCTYVGFETLSHAATCMGSRPEAPCGCSQARRQTETTYRWPAPRRG